MGKAAQPSFSIKGRSKLGSFSDDMHKARGPGGRSAPSSASAPQPRTHRPDPAFLRALSQVLGYIQKLRGAEQGGGVTEQRSLGGTQEEDGRKASCEVVRGMTGVPAAEMGTEALRREPHGPAAQPSPPPPALGQCPAGRGLPHALAGGASAGSHMPGRHPPGDAGDDGARRTDAQRPGLEAHCPRPAPRPPESRGLAGRACPSLFCFPDPRSCLPHP